MPIPERVKPLLDANTFVVVTTINPDGSPQSTVVWVKRDGDDVVFSTTAHRRKGRNLERDPRISVCLYDPDNPYDYVTLTGDARVTTEGGRELIDELSVKYTGEHFHAEPPETVRIVVRVNPSRAVGDLAS